MTTKNHVKLIKSRCIEDPSTGCWNWTGATHRQGYGFIRHNEKMKTIQRVLAIELSLFPEIDFNSRIGNSCGNKLCGNPDHIICQTQTEVNIRRYATIGTSPTFSDEQCLTVKEEYKRLKGTKGRVKKLADNYSVNETMIYRMMHRADKLM